jgi:hypothetical protein
MFMFNHATHVLFGNIFFGEGGDRIVTSENCASKDKWLEH